MSQIQIDPPIPPVTGVNPASINIALPPYVSPLLRKSEFIGQYGETLAGPTVIEPTLTEVIAGNTKKHLFIVAVALFIVAYLILKK